MDILGHHQKTWLFWGIFICNNRQGTTEWDFFFLGGGGGLLKFRTFLKYICQRFLIFRG